MDDTEENAVNQNNCTKTDNVEKKIVKHMKHQCARNKTTSLSNIR